MNLETLLILNKFQKIKIPKSNQYRKKKIIDFNKQQKVKGLHSDLAMNIKILTLKQMLQRLPIALPQVKACNTSEKLLNEIRQIIYSLHRQKQVTKKAYNNMNNSIKL